MSLFRNKKMEAMTQALDLLATISKRLSVEATLPDVTRLGVYKDIANSTSEIDKLCYGLDGVQHIHLAMYSIRTQLNNKVLEKLQSQETRLAELEKKLRHYTQVSSEKDEGFYRKPLGIRFLSDNDSAARGKKIPLIILIREFTGIGLKEAKDLCEGSDQMYPCGDFVTTSIQGYYTQFKNLGAAVEYVYF
jgi:ribosomal protein L7/L12